MPDQQEASFSNIPTSSEGFGSIPNASVPFRSVPKASERKENHILTVREVAKMFEAAGVARTERSIVNWCQPNSTGVARLDAYLDPNEGKYFITPHSAEAAIKEEQAKFSKTHDTSEAFGTMPRNAEKSSTPSEEGRSGEAKLKIKELEKQIFDLQVLNAGKDYVIDQLRGERDEWLSQLLENSRRVGELETKLQLEAPKTKSDEPKRIHVVSETSTSPSEQEVTNYDPLS